MTLTNVLRGLRTSVLAAVIMCAGSLAVTSGCAENCEKCEKSSCEKPCAEGSKAEKHEHKEKAEKKEHKEKAEK